MSAYASSRHAMCDLSHHRPGSRVHWREWDRAERRWVRRKGTVMKHLPGRRMAFVQVDGGPVVETCCSELGTAEPAT